jgi:hypothetical protein
LDRSAGQKTGGLNGGLQKQTDIGHVARRQLGFLQSIDGSLCILAKEDGSIAGAGLATRDSYRAQVFPY